MPWWVWLLIGFVLVGVELLSPGQFFIFFFGVAALCVGVLDGLGLAGPVWMQWLLFSVLTVASLALFRSPLLRRLTRDERPMAMDTLAGEIAVPLERIHPGEVGRVELRGTTWSARNDDKVALEPGRRCRVDRVDGLLLLVRPE